MALSIYSIAWFLSQGLIYFVLFVLSYICWVNQILLHWLCSAWLYFLTVWRYAFQCFCIDISVQVQTQYCQPKATLKAIVHCWCNLRALIKGIVGHEDLFVWKMPTWEQCLGEVRWDNPCRLTPPLSNPLPSIKLLPDIWFSHSTATVPCFYFAIHNFLFVSISRLWQWTLPKLCLKNLTSVCCTASVMLFLSAMAALSSKISSRLVKHDLLCLNVCWLSLIKLSFQVFSFHIP